MEKVGTPSSCQYIGKLVVLLHYKHVRSMTNLEEENDTTKINPSHNMDQELCNKVLTTLYHVMKSWRFAKSEVTFETKIGQHHQIGICQRHQLTVREVGVNQPLYVTNPIIMVL